MLINNQTANLLPPALTIKAPEGPELSTKILTSRAQDWKYLVPGLSRDDKNTSETNLQIVLDLVSPVKTPGLIMVNKVDSAYQTNPVNHSLGLDYDFVDENLLGEGQSKVRLVIHHQTNQKVAVKIFEKARLKDNHNALIAELMLLGGLYHENINPILQIVDSTNEIYMIMKLEDGGDLFNYIMDQGSIPEPQARQIFLQVISAVRFLHEIKIVHRDLKPENFLLDRNMAVKLCDFGFATVYNENVPLEQFCGSAEYSAPELIGRKPYIGPEIDIWSLGVMLFVMVSGEFPFGDSNRSKLFISIMSANYRIPSFFTPQLSSLISKILVSSPQARATIRTIWQHEWINSPIPFDSESPKNEIPKISPQVMKQLLNLGYTQSEIDEYQTLGRMGPVKAATFLLQAQVEPRTKRRVSETPPTVHKYSRKNTENFYALITDSANSNPLSPLYQIKQQQMSDIVMEDYPVIHQLGRDPMPTIVSFEHFSDRRTTHQTLFQKVLALGGRIPEVEEEATESMIIEVPMKRKQLIEWGNPDGDDPEIMACFTGHSAVMDMRFRITTTSENNGAHCTVFMMLPAENIQDGEWIGDQVDDFCLDLMSDIP